ncbi:hypothetical protein [Bacillus sp. AFS041924]|uniref:hypothetical protein n=1 Tax=Bacillus sp. AFS041924 TaxID=2033503 RepID=UPI000BFC0BD1|nr:hypothetical protein [Bacillus sp. AFS041924]PGS46765.1 hypothetical protein COC46_20670 [Bacillus sp. AFS041924]
MQTLEILTLIFIAMTFVVVLIQLVVSILMQQKRNSPYALAAWATSLKNIDKTISAYLVT